MIRRNFLASMMSMPFMRLAKPNKNVNTSTTLVPTNDTPWYKAGVYHRPEGMDEPVSLCIKSERKERLRQQKFTFEYDNNNEKYPDDYIDYGYDYGYGYDYDYN